MKSIVLAILFVGLATAEQSEFFSKVKRSATSGDEKTCFNKIDDCCQGSSCDFDCSSLILDKDQYKEFVSFTNEHLVRSYEYFFLSAQFGTFAKDRPGFEKILHGLSDASWNKGLEMIQESAKRGVTHTFKDSTAAVEPVNVLDDLTEVQALAKAAEIEKNLLIKANDIHRRHSHASTSAEEGKKHGYDSGISHYIEEEIIEGKTQTVRNLVGHVNDLKNLFKKDEANFPLSLYLFDQYLQNK